jgi:G3E family GTPase
MIKIDLITGFLGSGKTTFIRSYIRHLLEQGENVCLLENDYGAVNVDTMLLSDLISDRFEVEMVAGGCDWDCHLRRFKSKLISMGMLGYTRVIVEPSGIYDPDEFFDTLREDPLDRWYEIGSVLCMVDPSILQKLSDEDRYVLATEASCAGKLIVSKMQQYPAEIVDNLTDLLNNCLEEIQCSRRFKPEMLCTKNWEDFTAEDFDDFKNAGYKNASYEKRQIMEENGYRSLYFMEKGFTQKELEEKTRAMFNDPSCGNIIRIKGFFEEDGWKQLNATQKEYKIEPLPKGQDIVIVIGRDLSTEKIAGYLGTPAEIHVD